MKFRSIFLIVLGLGLLPGHFAAAQDAATEKAIERYRQMLREDPWSNPGLLDSDRGEALWKTPRGPKNVTLEQCDLGKGPGKVEGAFAELPRYFKDADRVMDVETRLLVVHGEAAGLQSGRSRQASASGRRSAGEGTRRDRDLHRQSIGGKEIRRQARSAAGKGGRCAGRGIVLPPLRDRSIFPARPATRRRACAFGCRGCRICPTRRRRAR